LGRRHDEGGGWEEDMMKDVEMLMQEGRIAERMENKRN
jgi:hypothetical protein